ncbi:MAG: alpha/beta hydrolase family esterase [Mariprofundaceae bacterium]
MTVFTARRHVLLACLAAFLIWPLFAFDALAGTEKGSLMFAGLKRTYRLHVPHNHVANQKIPLLLVLHGGGQSGRKIERGTGFSKLADREGFIAAYPDAFEHHWNDGRGVPRYRAQSENIDDVGFLAALIGHVANQYTIDRQRIYITGGSNGAMMTMRFACERADLIAGIAPVIGAMPANIASSCHPSRSISVLMINGTEDPMMPWKGGSVRFLGKRTLGEVLAVPKTAQIWAQFNGCRENPSVSLIHDKDPRDRTQTVRIEYSGCREEVRVVLHKVQGGGHTWPGGKQYLPRFLIGPVSRDFDATPLIWGFFRAIPPRKN